jgi:hypothetical protein
MRFFISACMQNIACCAVRHEVMTKKFDSIQLIAIVMQRSLEEFPQ